MEIIRKQEKDISTISIIGRLDAVTAVEAEQELNQAIKDGTTKLLLNLEELEYVSSAGLRILLLITKNLQQKGGKVVLANLSANVKEIFDISGFTSIFTITDSVEDGIEAIG